MLIESVLELIFLFMVSLKDYKHSWNQEWYWGQQWIFTSKMSAYSQPSIQNSLKAIVMINSLRILITLYYLQLILILAKNKEFWNLWRTAVYFKNVEGEKAEFN